MVALRWLVLVALVLVLNLTLAAEPQPRDKQPAPPTKAQIRGWILQLGDDDFEKREEASKKLWEAGEAAEAAVREAANSDDAEVARRARELWEKFQLGIYPTTPAAMLDLIGRYQQAEPAAKFQLVEEFMKNGPAGCRLLFKILEPEAKTGAAILSQATEAPGGWRPPSASASGNRRRMTTDLEASAATNSSSSKCPWVCNA